MLTTRDELHGSTTQSQRNFPSKRNSIYRLAFDSRITRYRMSRALKLIYQDNKEAKACNISF